MNTTAPPLFAYGTMLDLDVLETVLGRPPLVPVTERFRLMKPTELVLAVAALTTISLPLRSQARMVIDLAPGPTSSVISHRVTTLGEMAIFVAEVDGRIGLYRSDGSADGTARVVALPAEPTELCRVDGFVYFDSGDATSGRVPSTLSTKPFSAFFGPTSTNTRAPAS